MSEATRGRLFGWSHAFDHPAVPWMTAGVAAILVLAAIVLAALGARGRLSPALRSELWRRYRSWLAMAPLMAGPVLLGAAWTIASVCVHVSYGSGRRSRNGSVCAHTPEAWPGGERPRSMGERKRLLEPGGRGGAPACG